MAIHDSYSSGKITLGVGFKVDAAELTQIKSQLASIQKMSSEDLIKLNPSINTSNVKQELYSIKKSAQELEAVLSKSFNSNLGTVNISKLKTELESLNRGALTNIYSNLQKAGSVGTAAFNSIASATMKSNLQLKESHSLLDKISTTFGNTVRYGISSSIFNRMVDSLSSAWNYTKALDSSLNDIRIVTGKSADEMERFAQQANKAAQRLGSNTKDYTNAALIYEQQGLPEDVVQARTEATIKAANVTGQSGREVSEQLTAVWNGYKVTAEESELYVDKLAKVAAGTAADLEELSTGMSKVASAAKTMGVDVDQLNAMLATVISVTREAPETIGTSFRTIFARLGDLKAGGSDEDGIELGKVSGQLKELGVNILDETGDMKEMGNVIEEIAGKWENWTRAQKQAVAVAMAGKMQYSRFIALFDNWDQYTNALNMSKNAMGELQAEQDIYMESTSAHLNTLEAAWERVADAFVDNEGINGLVDVLTGLTNGFANFIEAIGGGGNALLLLGSIATKVFSNQIANGLNTVIENSQIAERNTQKLQHSLESLQLQQDAAIKTSVDGQGDKSLEIRIQKMQELIELFKKGLIRSEDVETSIDEINKLGEAVNKVQQIEQKQTAAAKKAEQEYLLSISDDLKKLDNEIQVAESRAEKTKSEIERERQQRIAEQKKQEKQNLISKVDGQEVLKQEGSSYDIYNEAAEKVEQKIKSSQQATIKLKDAWASFSDTTSQASDNVREISEQIEQVNRQIEEQQQLQLEAQEQRNSLHNLTGNEGANYDKDIARREISEAQTAYNRAQDRYTAERIEANQTARDAALNHLQALRRLDQEYDNSVSRINTTAQSINNLTQRRTNLQQQLQENIVAEQAYNKAIQEALQAQENLKQKLMELNTLPFVSDNQKQQIQEMLTEFDKIKKDDLIPETVIVDFETKIDNITNSVIQKLRKFHREIEVGYDSIDSNEKGIAENEVQVQEEDYDNKQKSFQRAARLQNIVKTIGAVGQLASAFQSLTNITNIWSSDTLTGGEKVLQTIMNLGTALPMIITQVKELAVAFNIGFGSMMAIVSLGYVAIQVWSDVIGQWVDNYNSAEIAAQESTKAVQEATRNYEEAQTAAESFKEAVSNYEDGIKSLKSLSSTTENYKQVLEETNQAAKDLIETYQLYSKYHIDSNGLITFDEGTLDEIQEQKNNAVTKTKINEYSSKIANDKNQIDNTKTNLSRRISLINAETGIQGSTRDKNMSDYSVWTEQTLSKDSVDSIIQSLNQKFTTDEEGYKELISDATGNKFREFVNNLGEANPAIKAAIEQIINSKQAFFDLANTTRKQEESEKYYIDQIAELQIGQKYSKRINQLSQDDTGAVNNQAVELITAATTNVVSNSIENGLARNREVLDEVGLTDVNNFKDVWGPNGDKKRNKDTSEALKEITNGQIDDIFETNEELARKYAIHVKGLSEEEVNALKFADNKLQDNDGNTIVDVSSNDERAQKREQYFNARALEYLDQKSVDQGGDSAEQILNQIESWRKQIKSKGGEIGHDLMNAITAGLADKEHKLDLSTLLSDVDYSQADKMAKWSDEQIKEYLGLNDERIALIGEDNANAWINKFRNTMANFDWDSAQAKLDIDTVSSTEKGKTIKADDYNQLSENAKKYFIALSDGTYKMVADSEVAKAALEDMYSDNFKRDTEKAVNNMHTIMNSPQGQLYANGFDVEQRQFGNINLDSPQRNMREGGGIHYEDGSVATVLGTSGSFETTKGEIQVAFSPLLETENGLVELKQGTVEDYIDSLINILETSGLEVNEENLLKLDAEGIGQNGQYLSNLIAGVGNQAEAISVLMHESEENVSHSKEAILGDLQVLQALGQEQDQYNEWINKANQDKLSDEDVEAISNAIDGVIEQYGSYEKAIDAIVNKYREEQLAAGLEYETIEALKEAYEEGKISLDAYNLAYDQLEENLDDDIDTEAFKDMSKYIKDNAGEIKGLSKDLKNNQKSIKDVAEETLRYDSALESVQKNWDDWDAMLKSGNVQDAAAAAEDLRNIYGDLLDLDGSSLSDNFLTSVDNLNLLKQAANGSEEAYNQLQEAAGKDILAQIGLDTTQFDSDKAWIENSILQLTGQDWDKIEVGADLNDEGFLQGLTDMVNNAGMTAQQATDYLSNMGVDAEIDTVENKEQETSEYVDATPIPTHETATGTNPVTGETQTYDLVGVRYETTKAPITTDKENKAFALKVTSAHKSSGGNFKFNNSSHGSGGAGQKARTPKKSGGGGSSSKPKEATKLDKETREKDYYHDIDLELKQNETLLSRIQKLKDRLSGKAYIQTLLKENDVLAKQNKILVEKRKIALQEQADLKKTITSQGARINSDGEIINYNAILDQKTAEINALIAQYNAMSGDAQSEQGGKDLKDKIEKAKKDLSEFQKHMDRYDEVTFTLIPELDDKAMENARNILDNRLELFTTEFELKVKITVDAKEFEQWRAEINGVRDNAAQNIIRTAQANVDYLTKSGDTFGKDRRGNVAIVRGTSQTDPAKTTLGSAIDAGTRIVRELTNDILTMESGNQQGATKRQQQAAAAVKAKYDTDGRLSLDEVISQAAEKLEEENKNLQEQLSTWAETYKDIMASFADLMSEAKSAFDDQTSLNEQIRDMIQQQMDTVELYYGSQEYDAFDRYYQQLDASYQKTVEANAEEVKFWEERMKSAEHFFGTESEEFKEARQNYMDAAEAWEKSISDKIQNLLDKYLNAVNQIFYNINQEMTNGLGLDYVSEEWELVNKNADQYLDNLNAMYNIQKLSNKYQDAIDQTRSLSAQQKLKAVQEEELELLRNKDKLSQYDIDRANLKYELTLKQIALEEAQQNKSTLRLRRDSQGNYSYQYAANDDELQQQKDEILDLYNQLYNLDKDKYNDNLDLIYQAYADCMQRIQDLAMDTSLSEEERNNRMQLAWEQYSEYVRNLSLETANVENNLNESIVAHHLALLGQDTENYKYMTNEQLQVMLDFQLQTVDKNNETYQELMRLYGEDAINYSTMTDEERAKFDEWMQHYLDTHENAKEAVKEKYGIDVENFKNMTDAEKQRIIDFLETEMPDEFTAWYDTDGQGAKDFYNKNTINYKNMTDEQLKYYFEQFAKEGSTAQMYYDQAFKTAVQYDDLTKKAYLAMNKDMIDDLTTNLVPTHKTSVAKMAAHWAAAAEGGNEKSFDSVVKKAIDSVQAKWVEYRKEVEKDTKKGGVKEYLETIQKANGTLADKVQTVVDKTKDLNSKYSAQFEVLTGKNGKSGLIGAVNDLNKKYETMRTNAISATSAANSLTSALNQQAAAYAKLAAEKAKAAATSASSGSNSSSSSSSKSSSTSSSSSAKTSTTTYTVKPNDTLNSIAARYGTTATAIYNKNASTIKSTAQVHGQWNSSDPMHWIYPGEVLRFASGGYTGEWNGEEGKLALLHEKELVLNKKDTENFLQAIEIMRDIITQGLNPTANKLISEKLREQEIEQNVHIEASFPNVKDAREVEDALNNLINRAAQRVNRKENY